MITEQVHFFIAFRAYCNLTFHLYGCCCICLCLFVGHKDSVTCIGFSWDSKYVATGDMSGLLKVWQVDTKQEVWSFEVSDLEVRYLISENYKSCNSARLV